jgi:hypothetical protein
MKNHETIVTSLKSALAEAKAGPSNRDVLEGILHEVQRALCECTDHARQRLLDIESEVRQKLSKMTAIRTVPPMCKSPMHSVV